MSPSYWTVSMRWGLEAFYRLAGPDWPLTYSVSYRLPEFILDSSDEVVDALEQQIHRDPDQRVVGDPFTNRPAAMLPGLVEAPDRLIEPVHLVLPDAGFLVSRR
jgi:hypothetical protein